MSQIANNHRIDYIELPVGNLNDAKQFYHAAFGWTFTDYGPHYSAFSEGLDGGFDASAERETKPLPVLYSADLERTLRLVEDAGAAITRPVFDFPGGRRFHFTDPAGNEVAVWAE